MLLFPDAVVVPAPQQEPLSTAYYVQLRAFLCEDACLNGDLLDRIRVAVEKCEPSQAYELRVHWSAYYACRLFTQAHQLNLRHADFPELFSPPRGLEGVEDAIRRAMGDSFVAKAEEDVNLPAQSAWGRESRERRVNAQQRAGEALLRVVAQVRVCLKTREPVEVSLLAERLLQFFLRASDARDGLVEFLERLLQVEA